tara:strand:- start:2228 stop:3085 length:858 start_codon:yes stop_codon:yes gene_type:complete
MIIIIILSLILILLLVIIKFYDKIRSYFSKNAVIVLTKGYDNVKDYKLLIKRNKHLEKYFNKHLSYLIFHEGNISIEHQNYIQKQTPKLKFKFINVSADFKKKDAPYYPPTRVHAAHLGQGYRNMCSFWFVSFWKYVKNYNKILRVDEDCDMLSDYNKIFPLLDKFICVCGKWEPDQNYVTQGLNKFTSNFFKSYNIDIHKKSASGPYTNVIGFNLDRLRENTILFKFIDALKKSNNIYIYRWGDLPVWGEVLHYMYPKNKYLIWDKITYHHGSHYLTVNKQNLN